MLEENIKEINRKGITIDSLERLCWPYFEGKGKGINVEELETVLRHLGVDIDLRKDKLVLDRVTADKLKDICQGVLEKHRSILNKSKFIKQVDNIIEKHINDGSLDKIWDVGVSRSSISKLVAGFPQSKEHYTNICKKLRKLYPSITIDLSLLYVTRVNSIIISNNLLHLGYDNEFFTLEEGCLENASKDKIRLSPEMIKNILLHSPKEISQYVDPIMPILMVSKVSKEKEALISIFNKNKDYAKISSSINMDILSLVNWAYSDNTVHDNKTIEKAYNMVLYKLGVSKLDGLDFVRSSHIIDNIKSNKNIKQICKYEEYRGLIKEYIKRKGGLRLAAISLDVNYLTLNSWACGSSMYIRSEVLDKIKEESDRW